jgi:ubiquinone/menaquinone biosynthesis C-methylase UbiE
MIGAMTNDHPYSRLHRSGRHDYLPAARYDALLPAYDLLSRALGVTKIHTTLLAQAELADGHRVLEIGSGTGNLAIRAKRSRPGADVIGVDPDPLALARAERKLRGRTGIRFDRGYAQNLPYPDGEFDRVLSSMMLHHLDSEAKAAAAAEVFRVLRPGGRLHLVDVGGSIPALLKAAGLDCTELSTRRHPVLGRVSFYRATRPS